MRSVLAFSVLALGLLISLCAPAGAATVHHFRSRHDVIIRPSRTGGPAGMVQVSRLSADTSGREQKSRPVQHRERLSDVRLDNAGAAAWIRRQ